MPRAALSQSEVDDFRESLCETATRLFAERGYEGVTMRALATSLGCSPMTPYRYFENKAEIFDAVRSAGFARFADTLEESIGDLTEHPAILRALCLAYVRFATTEPHAYRIMFQLDQPATDRQEDLRSWIAMHGAVTRAITDGELVGDPDIVAHLLWSGIHGLVALHLSGHLSLGVGLDQLVEAFLERELRNFNPKPMRHPS